MYEISYGRIDVDTFTICIEHVIENEVGRYLAPVRVLRDADARIGIEADIIGMKAVVIEFGAD